MDVTSQVRSTVVVKAPPLGIRLMEKIPVLRSLTVGQKTLGHQANVLFLTFLSYAAYHAARKPTSVVKNVLHRKNCSHLLPPVGLNVTEDDNTWCSWHPFEESNADTLLGWLDSTFLFAYALGMYFTGPLAERVELRYFLPIGMILSGFFSFLFGLAYWADIHSFAYFIIIQILAGLCQSTGWPGCVAAVGNWFGKSKRGLIMGIWRSHHSVGNMVGSLMASAFVEYNWGLSFAVPSALIIILGLIIFLFLASDPKTVGCPSPDYTDDKENESILSVQYGTVNNDSKVSEIEMEAFASPAQLIKDDDKHQAISFWKAIWIPGVIEYSLALFFSKLINYTFLYWLPRYIKESGLNLGDKGSADLSTLFDVGGIFGGIFAGLVSDVTGMSAVTCAVSIILAFPMLIVYQIYGSISGMAGNMAYLFIIGLLVNVPYALITTSISADLGTRLKSSKALATVTGILDGTGSIGAAVGPLMAGYLSFYGWQYVFYVLLAANGMALLFLTRLVVRDIRSGFSNWKRDKSVTRSSTATAVGF